MSDTIHEIIQIMSFRKRFIGIAFIFFLFCKIDFERQKMSIVKNWNLSISFLIKKKTEYSYFYICKTKSLIHAGDETIEYKLHIRTCADLIDLKETRRPLATRDLDYKVIFNPVNNDNFFEKSTKWSRITSNYFFKSKKKNE